MIYLLTVLGDIDWDSYDSKVVRADSEEMARNIANDSPGMEGEIWDDPKKVSCEVVNVDGPFEVVSSSFNAG